MKESLQISGAVVGLIVGGGFASGQEIMQYFTGFGWYGILGGVFATLGFAILSMKIVQLGSELQTASHKEVVYHIAGRSLGTILDILITFFLFCVTVAMFAGTAAAFELMFGIDGKIGSFIMVLFTVFTLMLNVRNIVNMLAIITPYLLLVILLIAGYSIFSMDVSLTETTTLASQQSTAASNWFVGALLYVSYNIAAAVAMMTVIGSTAKSRRAARVGGFFGGVLLGILIILINVALFAKMDVVAGTEMPILAIAIDLHPFVGILMAITLLGMIYSTAVGMLYAFIARIVSPKAILYKPTVLFVGLLGFLTSFVGFTTLVSKVYAAMGYLGFAIIFVIMMHGPKSNRHQS